VISTLVGGEPSASRLCHFIPREMDQVTHWIEGWVGPTDCLNDMGKWKFLMLQGLELWPLSCPLRSTVVLPTELPRLFYPFKCMCWPDIFIQRILELPLTLRIGGFISSAAIDLNLFFLYLIVDLFQTTCSNPYKNT
jgi:hypothetical protein